MTERQRGGRTGPIASPDGAAVASRPDPRLTESVRARLAESAAEPSPARVAEALRAEGVVLGDVEVLALTTSLRADLAGMGPLEPLLHRSGVTDILVNGPDEVWVDDGDGLSRVDIAFPDEGAVRRLAQRLAAAAGRRLDDAAPWVDARLADGCRLHAVLPPVAPAGTCISVRVPRRASFGFAELIDAGTIPPTGAELLASVVRARLAFLVTGGTGSGKTTLLAALLGRVEARERIVLVEDSGELRPDHPHVIRLEARPANAEGTGTVVLRDLVRQALRMRPDRLVVGEVRGHEVVDLLSALNTGHEGGCGTLHANAAADVPARLEALAVAAGLSRPALHSQLAAALDVVVHLERGRDARRRVAEICVLHRRGDGLVEARPALRFEPDGAPRPGAGIDDLRALLRSRGEPS